MNENNTRKRGTVISYTDQLHCGFIQSKGDRMTETQTITLTNIQMLQQSYPGFDDLLLTGIPDPELVSSLLRTQTDDEQRKIIVKTNYGKVLLNRIEEQARGFHGMVKELQRNERSKKHLENQVHILDSTIEDYRTKIQGDITT